MDCFKDIIGILSDAATAGVFIYTAILFHDSKKEKDQDTQIKIIQARIDMFIVLAANETFQGMPAIAVLNLHFTSITRPSKQVMYDAFIDFNKTAIENSANSNFRENVYLMELVNKVIDLELELVQKNPDILKASEKLNEQIPILKTEYNR